MKASGVALDTGLFSLTRRGDFETSFVPQHLLAELLVGRYQGGGKWSLAFYAGTVAVAKLSNSLPKP